MIYAPSGHPITVVAVDFDGATASVEHPQQGLLDLSREEWGELLPAASDDLFPDLSLERAVERRTTYGGTSPAMVEGQMAYGEELVARSRERRKKYVRTVTPASPNATETECNQAEGSKTLDESARLT